MSGTEAFIKDLQEQRSYFPALSNKAYFNYGGQGVLSKQATSAIFCSFDYVQTNGPFSFPMLKWLEEEEDKTKQAIASQFNCAVETLAMTANVTEGCNIVIWGIDWQQGDHLLTTDSEHPSIVAIVEQLGNRRGVDVGFVPMTDPQIDPVESIIQNLKPKTRLVVLSHVLWNTGRILPVKEIAAALKQNGVQLLVDGAQSAGIMPVDLAQLDCDYYAISGHKWFCGPEGVGILYVRQQLLHQLHPTFVGWRGVEALERGLNDASRFEVATAPFPLYAGLREAISVHDQWAPLPKRFEQSKENVANLVNQLKNIKGVKLTYDGPRAGLVTFNLEGKTPKAVVSRLEAERVLVRTVPYPECVRASVHYLTSSRDIERLAAGVASI